MLPARSPARNRRRVSPRPPGMRRALRSAENSRGDPPGDPLPPPRLRLGGLDPPGLRRPPDRGRPARALHVAWPDEVEFREIEVPADYYPPGGSRRESWRTLYYANLTANFASEVLGELPGNEGNFDDGLWVQQVINAVELSHHERRWVGLPLDSGEAPTGEAT